MATRCSLERKTDLPQAPILYQSPEIINDCSVIQLKSMLVSFDIDVDEGCVEFMYLGRKIVR